MRLITDGVAICCCTDIIEKESIDVAPIGADKKKARFKESGLHKMARSGGFEPPTAWFVARYSIQLSYERVALTSANNTENPIEVNNYPQSAQLSIQTTTAGI